MKLVARIYGLFFFLVLLQIVYFVYLVVSLRIPAGHDAFQYFSLQYYFLNHAVSYGEIPRWMPFMTMGTVASWWYAIQAGFIQNAMFLCASFFKHLNFIYCYDLGMFFDELILVAGCWLWGKRFLKHDWSVLFFSASVWGGAISLTQPWYNLHSYYCLPLILHFFHSFLEKGRWRYFLAGCHLMLMQTLGNMPYFFPLISYIVFLYFLLLLFFQTSSFQRFLKKSPFNIVRGIIVFIILGATCYMIYSATAYGTDQIVNYNIGREIDGKTTLENFLTYGGDLNLFKWKELALGLSPELNYNLYGGIMVMPLLIWVLGYGLNRRTMPLILLVILLVDFSMGGATAVIGYAVWPLMKYFRHVELVSAIIKIFIFLTAAVAFDCFVSSVAGASKARTSVSAFIPSVYVFLILLWQKMIANPDSLARLIEGMIPADHPDLLIFQNIYIPFIKERIFVIFCMTAGSCILWFVLAILKGRKIRRTLLLLILVLHLMDMAAFKFHETRLRSGPAGNVKTFLNFQKMPYAVRRELPDQWRKAGRAAIIKQLRLSVGVQYWSNDSLMFRDSAGHPFRTDHWLVPLDQFMRTYWGLRLNDFSLRPPGSIYHPRLDVPLLADSAQKMAGLDVDKIQFFKDALFASSEQRVSTVMKSPLYRGDIPVILDTRTEMDPQDGRLGENDRLTIQYEVRDFSSNRLNLDVVTDKPGWLFYSDVWHPYWHASVNGREVKVSRANLAFKIVPVPKGPSQVNFYFEPGSVQVMQKVLSVFSLIWIAIVIYMVVRLIITPYRNLRPFKD